MTDRVWSTERWDRGLWDQAHWNGQLGFNAQAYTVTVNTPAATLRHGYVLTAAAAATIDVQAIPVICRSGRGLRAQPLTITVTAFVVYTPLTWHMAAEPALVEVTVVWANLVPFFGAGELHFGIPTKLRRW
jgi:hypothetical protein